MKKILTNNHNFNREAEFKIQFKEHQTINTFYSQAGQDLFVLMALNGKKNGKFVEIGSWEPKFINNTYLLESKFNWKGVLIEIDESFANKCKKERTSSVICGDATKLDYELIFKELKEIDYVSLDIDGMNTLHTLEKLPLNEYKVKVITFEHDLWRTNAQVKNKSRRIFDELGYERICGDVANKNNIYEDWYVHPELVDIQNLKNLKSNGKNWDSILFNN
jgi:hypothetical protein